MLGTPIWPNMRVPGPRLKNPSANPDIYIYSYTVFTRIDVDKIGMKSEKGVQRQIRKTTKKPPKKSVETYSPSNAVAPDLREEVNRVNHKIYDIKLKQVNLRLTDVE